MDVELFVGALFGLAGAVVALLIRLGYRRERVEAMSSSLWLPAHFRNGAAFIGLPGAVGIAGVLLMITTAGDSVGVFVGLSLFITGLATGIMILTLGPPNWMEPAWLVAKERAAAKLSPEGW